MALETGTHSPAPAPPRLGYRAAFDGLRAIAITLVVPYHWLGDQTGIAGGWLGVNLFFVVSGFLITRLLVEEHARRRSIDAAGFYRRRAARLLPAYMTMLFVVIVLAEFAPMFGPASGIRVGAVSSFFYVANWAAISRGLGALGPFAHLWSLSLEEQFYVIWALTLIVLLRRMPARRVGVFAACATGVVFIELFVRSLGSFNETALYIGTTGQGMAFLLAGCATALLVPVTSAEFLQSRLARGLRRYGWLAILPLVPFVLFVDHNGRADLYRGWLVLLAACMVTVLLTALVGSALGRVLGWSGVVWLGRRSYSVYLWHYPTLVAVSWCNGRYDLGWDLPVEAALAAAITLALAEASYVAVERPLRLRFAGARPAEIPAGVAA